MGYCIENNIDTKITAKIKSTNSSTVDFNGDWVYSELYYNKVKYPNFDAQIKRAAKALNIDIRLCASQCKKESGFKNNLKSSADAKGIWQIKEIGWKQAWMNSSLKDKYLGHFNEYINDPDINTDTYIELMRQNMAQFSKTVKKHNDVVALSMQKYHDGSIAESKPTDWASAKKRQFSSKTAQKEADEYVPKILEFYKEFIKNS